MRIAASLLLATALTAPAVALASGSALRDDLAAMDVTLSWSDEREEADGIALADAVIMGDRLQIEAEQLLYDPDTGEVTLTDVRFIDRRGETAAEASAQELIAQDAQSFHLVNETEICGSEATDDLHATMTEMRGLTVIPEQQSESRMGAERFAMDRVVARSRVAADGSCVTFDEAQIQGVTSVSPAGDTATIEAIDMRAAFDGQSAAAFDFDLRNLTATDAGGRAVASFGRMAISTNVTGDIPQSVPTDPGRAFDMLLRTSGTHDIEIRDLFVETPEEFGGDEMRGHIVARFAHNAEAIDTLLDIDVQGLARLNLDLGLVVQPEGTNGGLSAMLGDEPGLAAAERLAISRLRFSAADLGAVDIAEQNAGMGRDEIMAQLRRQLGRLPQPLIEPTTSFAEAVLDGGAGFRAEPPQPVALTQIIMTGMLQPQMLGSILAISAD